MTLSPAVFTSVTYTRPASASPLVTLFNTSVTEASSLTGLSVMPVAVSTFWVAEPQGTAGAQTTTFTPGLARSAKAAILAGLSGGTAICSVFEAKFTGAPSTRLSLVAFSMFLVSAEANTSAGAPDWIWVTRSDDPAKLNATWTPGWLASNCSPNVVKVVLSDAAANTVRVCWEVLACPAGWAGDPQAAARASIRAEATVTVTEGLFTILRGAFR